MNNEQLLIDITKCSRCGKCGAICPMYKETEGWDTDVARGRVLLTWGLARGDLDVNQELVEAIYRCPTCMMCEQQCTSGVKVTEIIRKARELLVEKGADIPFSHKAAFDLISRITLRDDLKRDWTDLIEGDFVDKGEIVYFVGSLPYIEPVMNFDIGARRIMSGAVKILNHAGIKPAIIPQLADSGHDAFWSGQTDLFNALREKNTKLLKGAKVIVTTCAEDYRTLSKEYSLPAKVYHISQYVRDLMKQGKLSFEKGTEKVTYHDPCRLGRHMGEFEAPREVLKQIADFKDMPRHGKDGPCCGVGAWMNCNEFSKEIRQDRLMEASQTAEIMITACSKCVSHFRCFLEEPNEKENPPTVKVMDFTDFVASKLK
ncbi:MAG: (Fe-S)-binding protein [Dehalococcoidia bacterium]|nr:(Fe-S)-binding protein [Dehalococcoidia bacterium]